MFYRLSEWFLSALQCSAYHQPDVYFDLIASDCPSLQEEKESYDLDTWFSNYIIFGDTFLSQNGIVMNLVDSSLCLERNPTTDPLPPTPAPSSNNTIIIIIVVIIVIIIIVVAIVLLLCKNNRKP